MGYSEQFQAERGSVCPTKTVYDIGAPCVSPALKHIKSLLVVSLQFGAIARHTQTVNLYAPLTLRFGLTHGRPCPQVWSGGRLAGPRCRTGLPYACV